MLRAGFAVVAGSGALPRLVAESLDRPDFPTPVLVLPGCEAGWMEGRPCHQISLQNYREVFTKMEIAGCRTIVLAGGVPRPEFRVLESKDRGGHGEGIDMLGGDDLVLRRAIEEIEEIGLRVVGAHEILPDVLLGTGVFTRTKVDDFDRRDALRAQEIVQAVGRVDVGQSAVVIGKICVAVEAIAGTDSMLAQVAELRGSCSSDLRCGVLYKAPKPGQDWRADLPAIGPATVKAAAAAGLAGIVIQANGVIVLDRCKTVRIADDLGLFIWSRSPVP